MATMQEHYEFRDEMADTVVRDLVGPGRNDEPRANEDELNEPPFQRYIAGALYPPAPGEFIDGAQDHDVVDEDDDGRADPPIALANVRYPSAMGLSFAVDTRSTNELTIEITAARYTAVGPIDDGDPENDGADGDGPAPVVVRPSDERWKRHPVNHSVTAQLSGTPGDIRTNLDSGLQLFFRERSADEDGIVAVTIACINRLELPKGEWRKDPYTFFQVEVSVNSPNGLACFVNRTGLEGAGVDDDARSYALLYRHNPTFATGHGCASEWTTSPDDPTRAVEVMTTVTPSHELLLADNNPDVNSPYFSMRQLATDDRSEICSGLKEFVAGYERWIKLRIADTGDLHGVHQETGRLHLEDCKVAALRMTEGIDLLLTDDDVWEAFRLANQAMLVQRARADWARSGAQGEPDISGDKHNWRAFQLGFILLTLAGTADPESDDRPVVDLLWFPTGGGKTEAYLGLIAFTVFLRRLRGAEAGDGGGGLTVIMRYTLRLLTLQQFERAAMLMCACESIRRGRDDLGKEEISICLWVGAASTPNDLSDTRTSLKALSRGEAVTEKDPVQLRSCPWCAVPLSYKNYYVADSNPRLVITCRNSACEFEKGLPCYLVDQDIYKLKPTLMIATVDKFASLPWRESVGPMFGMDSETPPPELIIQDELHLISGPLGTMVGLYEAAISMLCADGGIGPKIIASTATIRRADEQINQLYAADGFQFPPPGIDARDSYFSVEVPREAKGTRRYLGLMAPGTSHTSLLVRAYAALLQTAGAIDAEDEVKDPYWTLLGYFNSLRVLGGALLQVRDDVVDRIEVLAEAAGVDPRLDAPELIEMTSRVESSKIPAHLELMGRSMDHIDCVDVVLATNMISVGVDVDRLGLMVVMGQPQSSSEYIQATSRVGRRHPGLVVTLFNSSKSRDRSHYEEFVPFHQSIYRQVDGSSLTPFAARARDRALHAVLIGMMRARYPEYRENKGAANVEKLDAKAQPVIQLIVNRVRQVDPDEAVATERVLLQIIDDWKRRAGDVPRLVFSHKGQPDLSLLSNAGQPDAAIADAMPTMWSLRAVDTESNLYLV